MEELREGKEAEALGDSEPNESPFFLVQINRVVGETRAKPTEACRGWEKSAAHLNSVAVRTGPALKKDLEDAKDKASSLPSNKKCGKGHAFLLKSRFMKHRSGFFQLTCLHRPVLPLSLGATPPPCSMATLVDFWLLLYYTKLTAAPGPLYCSFFF
jgi:hypothetical protein